MIKTIIFDWDGVIVDSMPFIAKGLQETAASYGVNVTHEEVLNGYFQPRDAYYRSLGIDTTDQEELNKRHWAAIHKHQQPAPIFPEVVEVLRFLKNNNYALGVASTAETHYILEQLVTFEIVDIFPENMVFGGELKKEEKLQKFIEIFDLKPDELLYVGDLPSDIEAAKKAHVQSAGIERREEALKKLAQLNPDYTFSSMADLKSLIEKEL
jgi:phosphoglycolate phosphatase-like HAD superfamily hydrolase